MSTAATIRWTNAGGNPLWTEKNNWDSLTVPTSNDDVIIDIPSIPGNVITTATPSYAKSLTVGGSSSTLQTVNVQGPLFLGSGKILGNGYITLNSGPDQSLYVSGTFDGGQTNHFSFISGALQGPGRYTFNILNMSGPAEKRINSTVTTSTLSLAPGRGSTGSINIVKGSLTVTGAFKTSDPLILSSSPGAELDVTGSFQYTAASAAYSATIRGVANIETLMVAAGTVILADNVTITSATLASGATLDLIGSAASTRKIGDITGAGILRIDGGSNTFTTLTKIGNVNLIGGNLVALTKAASIGDLQQTGGVLQGPAPLSVTTGSFSNAQISGLNLSVSTFTLLGFASLSASSLTITQNGIISQSCQVTLSQGSYFNVASSASVSQSASFEILKSNSQSPAPIFTNNGQWTSTSDLSLLVTTQGTGNFQLATGSTTSITGISFTTGSIIATAATVTSLGSTFTASSIAGTGKFINQGNTFTVNGTINANSFTQTNGATVIGTGSIVALDVQTGTFVINGPAPPTGALLSVSSFSFEGGIVSSLSATSNIAVDSLSVTGNQPKTFSSITVNAAALKLDCGSSQCQLFTQNAHIVSGSNKDLIN